MTHAELVEVARSWLIKTKKCSVVLAEIATSASEEPDALGWNSTHTILVECKASRADFLADRRKIYRHKFYDGALGDHRWMLTPTDVAVIKDVSELPQGWGWAVFNPETKKVRVIHNPTYQEQKGHRQETLILLSALKRIGHAAPAGVSIKCYVHETNNRASLDVAVSEGEGS